MTATVTRIMVAGSPETNKNRWQVDVHHPGQGLKKLHPGKLTF